MIGDLFYSRLLATNKGLIGYFNHTDMDELVNQFVATISVVVEYVSLSSPLQKKSYTSTGMEVMFCSAATWKDSMRWYVLAWKSLGGAMCTMVDYSFNTIMR